MHINELVVEVFADQLNRYARSHQGFDFEPPTSDSVTSNLLHLFLNFLATCFLCCRKLECPVCFSDEDDFCVFLPCCHIICIPCCRRWYKDKIERGGTCDSLTCISPGCSIPLSLVNREKVLTESSRLQLRYNHYVKALAHIAEENKLRCPQPDCPGYFIRMHTNISASDYDSDSAFAVCPLCFIYDRVSVYCFKCRKHHSKEEHYALGNLIKYKTGKVMKNWFGISLGKETESEALVRSLKLVTKKCPACGIPCEKDESCNHCTCLNCGVEFNWAKERLWEGYNAEFRRNAVFTGGH